VARLCGACCGLVVFSAMILRGLAVGNSAQVIILRAVTGLFAGLVLGSVVGWVGMILIRDHLPDPPEPEPEAAPPPNDPSVVQTVY
jgi:MFS family permease